MPWELGACMCVCGTVTSLLGVCATACTSSCTGATVLGTLMSRRKKLGTRIRYLSPVARGIYPIPIHICRYIYIYINNYYWTSNLISQRGEDHEAIGAVYVGVSTECLWLICVTCNECMFVCVFSTYIHVCMWLWKHAQPLYWLDLRHGAVQPHFYEAAGFGSPNTVFPVARSMAMQLLCQSCPEPGPCRPRGERARRTSRECMFPHQYITLLNLSGPN